MQQAIEGARQGILNEEGGPFGACVVKKGKLISVGWNTVLKENDPTCHAEMNAIRKAARVLGSHLLEGCELYTTAEPCPMCLAAAYWARLEAVHVGASAECAARHGFDDVFFYEQLALPPEERSMNMTFGCCERDCIAVFEEWKKKAGKLY